MGSDSQGTASKSMMVSTVEPRIGDKFIRPLVFTMVISMMSATMFNIVLPEISQEYGLTYRQVSWVSSAYLLVYAIGSMIYSKLSDRYRLKSLLTMGLLLLSVGSLIGLVAQNYWMVLLSAWNPFYIIGEGVIYNNLYLILSLSYAGLILIHLFRFKSRTPTKVL
ncbi:hypothetical protein J2TS4_09270 [Paenibacillus sp. J2TS4]|nr:hypothetical protein J2TS4_09270 [Paenibacillus sp. J2TS4]